MSGPIGSLRQPRVVGHRRDVNGAVPAVVARKRSRVLSFNLGDLGSYARFQNTTIVRHPRIDGRNTSDEVIGAKVCGCLCGRSIVVRPD